MAEKSVLTDLNINGNAIKGAAIDEHSSISGYKIAVLTAEQYEALATKDNHTIYLIKGNPEKYQRRPVVIWETDGSTGLLGHNNNTPDNNWQLENLDFNPYTRVECHFKAAATASADTFTPGVIITIQLAIASKGPSNYYGSVMVPLPFNRNREYLVTCAIDTTKTKFQVVHQNTLWDISTSNANTDGRYCYKILGFFD